MQQSGVPGSAGCVALGEGCWHPRCPPAAHKHGMHQLNKVKPLLGPIYTLRCAGTPATGISMIRTALQINAPIHSCNKIDINHQLAPRLHANVTLCTIMWGLSSHLISSLQNNNIHPPEMEVNPPKMECGCPCGRVIISDMCKPLALWNA